jgi:Flp pilus assembly protein TadD
LLTRNHDRKSLEEAGKHAQAALTLLPEDPDALNVVAVTELRLGRPDSAESYLDRAIRKAPGKVKSWVGMAEVRLTRNDVAGAEKALKQASINEPTSPEARNFLGEFYAAHGRAPEAEQQFRQALALDPKNGSALMDLGAIEANAGQTDEAEKTYRQAAALPERQYKPVHAEFLLRSGKHDQAVAEFEKLAAADPEDINLRTKLVDTYLALHRAGDAERVLNAAVKKNGLDEDARMRRSRIYLDLGRYTEAESDLNQVLHLHKDSAQAYYLLSKVHQGRGIASKEKRALEEVLKIDPGFLVARIDLAKTLLASQSAASALTVLDEAPDYQLNEALRVLERNWVLLALGKKEEARRGIERVLATAKLPEALLQDAAWKLDRKDYGGARKSAEEALN